MLMGDEQPLAPAAKQSCLILFILQTGPLNIVLFEGLHLGKMCGQNLEEFQFSGVGKRRQITVLNAFIL